MTFQLTGFHKNRIISENQSSSGLQTHIFEQGLRSKNR